MINKGKKDVALPDSILRTFKNIRRKNFKMCRTINRNLKQWTLETIITIQIIISQTGKIPKNTLKEFKLIPKIYVNMQRATIIETWSIVRTFLDLQ